MISLAYKVCLHFSNLVLFSLAKRNLDNVRLLPVHLHAVLATLPTNLFLIFLLSIF